MILKGIQKSSLLIVFAGMVSYGIGAQEKGGDFLLPEVFSASVFNPAHQNKTGHLVIGVPFLSGISGDWHSSVPLNTLFSEGFHYSFQRFYDALDPVGDTRASASINLFNASWGYEEFTFHFSVSERLFTTAVFDRGLVRLIRDGTRKFYGSDEVLGTASFHFQNYRELAAGLSKNLWEGLSLGFRAKILFGRLYFDARDLQLSVETDAEKEELLVRPEGSFILSGPLENQYFSESGASVFSAHVVPGDYFFQPRNLGVGIDIGAVFHPSDWIELDFSLMDLGFTSYRHNTFSSVFKGAARFSENTLYQSDTSDGNDYLEPREALRAFGDSASYLMDVNEAFGRTITGLPLQIQVSAKYRFSPALSGGVNNRFVYFQNQGRNLFSAFLQTRIRQKLSLAGSLSLAGFSAIHPGLGVSYTGKKAQLFFASHNILGIVQPSASKHLNLHFGMNLLFDTQ